MLQVVEKQHPSLGILVRSNGQVLVPANYHHKEHWTFGCSGYRGYKVVRIKNHGYYVHRLVAETFLPTNDTTLDVDHIDRDTANNCVSNLRWVTCSENLRNTSQNDKCFKRLGVHKYNDPVEYNKRNFKEWYSRTIGIKRLTMRAVRFSNGKIKWLPIAEAQKYLQAPLKQRIYLQ